MNVRRPSELGCCHLQCTVLVFSKTCSYQLGAVPEHSLDTLGTRATLPCRSLSWTNAAGFWVYSAPSFSPAQSLQCDNLAVNSETSKREPSLGPSPAGLNVKDFHRLQGIQPAGLKDKGASSWWSLLPAWALLQRDNGRSWFQSTVALSEKIEQECPHLIWKYLSVFPVSVNKYLLLHYFTLQI